MVVGDLIKHRDYDQYGIVLDIHIPEQGNGIYFVILWAGKLTTDWVWNDMVVKA